MDYGKFFGAVRGEVRSLFRLSPINARQCVVSVVQIVDPKGRLPTWVVNKKIPEGLGGIEEIRASFDRSEEVDKANRDELAEVIRGGGSLVYETEEDEMIESVQSKLGALRDEDFVDVESPDHLVQMRSVYSADSSKVNFRASTVVDASAEEAAAWEMAKMSRENMLVHVRDGGLERSLVEINEHHFLYRVV